MVLLLLAGTTAVPAVVVPYSYLSQWGTTGTGNGQFDNPNGITVNSSGYVYVADTDNDRIQVFTPSGVYVRKWGGSGVGAGKFFTPNGITVNAAGSVYVADTGNNRVQVFSPSGTYVSEWGSGGAADGQFDYPTSVAVNSSGSVYVVDEDNNRIQLFDSSGTFLSKWGSFGVANGQFDEPWGITTNASGTVFVTDSDNDRVQVFNPSGAFLSTWGSNGAGDGQFDCPSGITIDSSGNIYVADCDNDRVQEFLPQGTFATKWGSSGSGNGQFLRPKGIAINTSGYVYVTDTINDRIQVFAPSPVITAVSPSTGTKNGGETVTITGAGLDGATSVMFGAAPASSYSVVSATQIRAVAPAQAVGTVDIRITTPAGTSAITVADQYTYTEPATPVPTPWPTSNGGDDFPGGTTRPAETAQELPPAETQTIIVNVGGNSAVHHVAVTGTGLSGLVMTGMTQGTPGPDVPPPPGIVYQYIDLVPARFTSITGAVITFTVPVSWLEEHHLTPREIVMYHYTGGKWVALPTMAGTTANGLVTFTATTPSFSLFAIVGLPEAKAGTTQKVLAFRDLQQPSVPVPAASVKTPVVQQTTAAPAPAVNAEPAFPSAVFVIAGMVVLAAGGFLVRRFWIRRQNPALFAEDE